MRIFPESRSSLSFILRIPYLKFHRAVQFVYMELKCLCITNDPIIDIRNTHQISSPLFYLSEQCDLNLKILPSPFKTDIESGLKWSQKAGSTR